MNAPRIFLPFEKQERYIKVKKVLAYTGAAKAALAKAQKLQFNIVVEMARRKLGE
jgi:hypothetical protein